MKKLILSFLFLMSFFAVNAQEVKESETTRTETSVPSEVTFSLNEKSETEIPKLIINRESIFDCWDGAYKLSDGTKLSNKEFNALLKAEANQIFVKKTKIYEGLFYLFDVGMLASVIVNSYAYSKGWDNMTFYSATAAGVCFVSSLWTAVLSNRNQQLAIDSYNLNILGLGQKK